jgi:outer membrane protein assembly factor BamA
MLRLSKYYFVFFLFSASLCSQTVGSINVTGTYTFDKDDIISWGGIKPGGKIFNGIVDSVKTRIAHNLAMRGYLHSNFDGTKIEDTPDTQKVDLNISIIQGDASYIKKINITGIDSLDSLKVMPEFNFSVGRIFNKFDLEDDISNILTYFEDNGYPFAQISIPTVYFYTDSAQDKYFADIHIKIDKGPLSRIDKIQIEGNNKTNPNVIIRELRIDKGELYSQSLIEEIPKRLNRLGFFEPVSPPEFFINSKSEGVLLIKVREKQTNNFDGVIGYIPDTTAGGSGYLTGLVNVSLLNMFGTGRAASIKWQQYSRTSQQLELKYLEPWLFGYPFNFTGSLSQRKQDSTYIQRTLQGTFEYLATETISASFFVSTESVIPTYNGGQFFTVYNSNSLTTGVNLKIDTRDDPYAPTEGILFINSYSFSSKKINGPAQYITSGLNTNIKLQRVELDLNMYYELLKRQIISLGLHGRELLGSFLEASDLYRLGGANTLRGYEEDQFLGSKIFWSNLEYRLLLAKRTFVFPFFDTGYYFRPANPDVGLTRAEGFRYGYGIGMDIETGIGVLSVSFALGEGDSFSNGKIHFGIVNEF